MYTVDKQLDKETNCQFLGHQTKAQVTAYDMHAQRTAYIMRSTAVVVRGWLLYVSRKS